MNELIEFLTKCNDEDETAAKEAGFPDAEWFTDLGDPGTVYADHENPWGIIEAGSDLAPHIAFHDPARVLRECAARRRVIERHSPHGTVCSACAFWIEGDPSYVTFPCAELLDSVQSYVDRPGFKDEWRVT